MIVITDRFLEDALFVAERYLFIGPDAYRRVWAMHIIASRVCCKKETEMDVCLSLFGNYISVGPKIVNLGSERKDAYYARKDNWGWLCKINLEQNILPFDRIIYCEWNSVFDILLFHLRGRSDRVRVEASSSLLDWALIIGVFSADSRDVAVRRLIDWDLVLATDGVTGWLSITGPLKSDFFRVLRNLRVEKSGSSFLEDVAKVKSLFGFSVSMVWDLPISIGLRREDLTVPTSGSSIEEDLFTGFLFVLLSLVLRGLLFWTCFLDLRLTADFCVPVSNARFSLYNKNTWRCLSTWRLRYCRFLGSYRLICSIH